MGKRITNLSHLLLGLTLLTVAGYSMRELADHGLAWWHEESSLEKNTDEKNLPTTTGSGPAGDVVAGPSNVEVFGILGEQNGMRDAGNEVPVRLSEPASLIDRVAGGASGAPNHLVHGRISVGSYRTLGFKIPPHAPRPHVEGTFRCVGAGQMLGGKSSVELLLLNEEDFSRFRGNAPWSSRHSARPSSFGDIDWDLSATFGYPRNYYLVFRNSSPRPGPAVVDADITVSVE